MRTLIAIAAFATLMTAACSLPGTKAQASPSSSPVPSALALPSGRLDAQVPMPPAFPAEVPIYPGARLTAGASFTSTGQMTWGMEWETLDSIQKVHDFYAGKLASGDWTIEFTASSGTAFAATFASKSNSQVKGALGADGTSGVTKISLYLAEPA